MLRGLPLPCALVIREEKPLSRLIEHIGHGVKQWGHFVEKRPFQRGRLKVPLRREREDHAHSRVRDAHFLTLLFLRKIPNIQSEEIETTWAVISIPSICV